MRNKIFDYLIIILCAFIMGIGFNGFLIPLQLLSGGISGVAIIVGYWTDWNIALLYFVFNFPVMIWGWIKIGRHFIYLSIVSVIFTAWFMELIPIYAYVQDVVLAAIFGGLLVGLGTGLSFRVGGSTGGVDIIGSVLTHNRDFPLGSVIFILNGFIIIALGYPDNWEAALYSMVSIFITGKLIDMIHISYLKITAFIVTINAKQLIEHLLKLPRGVTVLKSKGAYSDKENEVLMVVTTRYELVELKKLVRQVDPHAFVNIVETIGVVGQFTKRLPQK